MGDILDPRPGSSVVGFTYHCTIINSLSSFSHRERLLLHPSQAGMFLNRTSDFAPLALENAIYYLDIRIDSEEAQCCRLTLILCRISHPYKFLYPALCYLNVRLAFISLVVIMSDQACYTSVLVRSIRSQLDTITITLEIIKKRLVEGDVP